MASLAGAVQLLVIRSSTLKLNNLEALLVIELQQRRASYEVDDNISKASDSRSMGHDVLEHILDGTEEPTNLPFELLKNITGNFSEEREIGHGGFGMVYKEKTILHMDLKPDNILLDNNMVAKISDFGLSRLDEKSQTMDAKRCVTLGYCSPEYLLGGKMSVKSDMYSLGVMIIELVTGYKDIPDNNNESDPYRRPFIQDIIHDMNGNEGTFGQNSNADGFYADQTRPCWDDDMLDIEPLKLHFQFELNKEISCLLNLDNSTTAAIAFAIQSVSPMPYCIQPNKGIVLPLSRCAIVITLESQSMPPKDMQHLGEFVVQSAKIIDGVTPEEITSDMFNKVSGEVVDEVNVDAIFDLALLLEES
uniref:Cysteine-rich receptor-like protein kinase 25 n=1 Tax=Aegilops tauschii TaxID=37682 RepID=M8CYQ2_AEGTA